MAVIQVYNCPKDMLGKLVREGRRTWLSQDLKEKSDHFFNFCVTSVSIRDWCISYLGLIDPHKGDFYKEHSNNQWLNYCASIANSSKHLKLHTDRIEHITSVDGQASEHILIDSNGNPIKNSNNERLTFKIETKDGDTLELMSFLGNVVDSWEEIFEKYGIKISEENLKVLMFVEYM